MNVFFSLNEGNTTTNAGFSYVAISEPNKEDIMSNDHAKKVIAEKLQSDAGLRDRVADFILYRGLLSNFDDLKSLRKEIPTQRHNGDEYCDKIDGFFSYLSSESSRGCPFEGTLQGYEYWVG